MTVRWAEWPSPWFKSPGSFLCLAITRQFWPFIGYNWLEMEVSENGGTPKSSILMGFVSYKKLLKLHNMFGLQVLRTGKGPNMEPSFLEASDPWHVCGKSSSCAGRNPMFYLEVFENRGTSKSFILMGYPYIYGSPHLVEVTIAELILTGQFCQSSLQIVIQKGVEGLHVILHSLKMKSTGRFKMTTHW